MSIKYEEISLAEYLARLPTQAEAAKVFGCHPSNISQALKDIADGVKTVVVRVFPDGTVEADIVKPFGRRRTV